MQHFYSFVFQVCDWWCPPLSVGREAFLFICFPGPLLLVLLASALFRWPFSISIYLSPRSVTAGVRLFLQAMQHSIHVSPRSVTAGVRPFPSAMQHFYSSVSQVCHCWCPPFSAGDATVLFICFPGLSLLAIFVSRVCHWCCRPFLLAMQHFCSFVSHVTSFFLSFRFGACTAVFCTVCWNRFTCERFLLL